MAETRWKVADPQNRIRRLAPVGDGTVDLHLVLPSDDPAAVQAVEEAAADAGVEITRVEAPETLARAGLPMQGPPPDSLIVNGIEYRPFRRVSP